MIQRLGIIAALDENFLIGSNGDLPWPRIPGDMKHFREVTLGCPVIMGRRTYESLGKPLVGRTNIVVTSRPLNDSGIMVARSFDDAVTQAQVTNSPRTWAMGGRPIFVEVLRYADVLELTEIHGKFTGDTYFPDFSADDWRVTKVLPGEQYDIVTYERRIQ